MGLPKSAHYNRKTYFCIIYFIVTPMKKAWNMACYCLKSGAHQIWWASVKVWKVNLTVRVICNAIFAFLLSFYLTALNESLSKTMDGWELSMQSIKTAFCFIYLSFVIYISVGNDEGSTEKTACIRQRYWPFLLFFFLLFNLVVWQCSLSSSFFIVDLSER